jgi:hypothetical protein
VPSSERAFLILDRTDLLDDAAPYFPEFLRVYSEKFDEDYQESN